MTHPLDLTAREIARGIRTSAFSAESVVAESIRRARIVEGALNPFTLIRAAQAMEAARRADQAVADGAATGPLHGVPFVAKDLTPTAGDLTTLGSWTRPDWVPDETALCIRRLQAAGAILIGKTTTPEFAYASFTSSPRWGVTRNPWNPDRTPGGSSGGSAVAVATGVAPFAEGTDMGGSVRIPAAFCGVVGFKPSLGRIPMTILPSLFDNISHFGPLARTVDDAVTFMEVTAGGSDEDISSLPIGFDGAAARAGTLRGRRFALSLDLGYYAVQPQVAALVRQAADALREAGAVVDEVAMDWTRAVNDQWFDLWCVFMSAYFGDDLAACRPRMDPAVVAMMTRGLAMDATTYKRVDLLRSAMWRDMARLYTQYDALICPTCAITAPPVSETDDDYVATLPDGRFGGLDMTCPFNLLPQLPALSVPIGCAADGLPVGLQIVGHRFADEQVLAWGAALETILPAPPCPVAGETSRT
ncbi:amidase [Gluconacetobacter johannae DSM 13595]|uniref:Amidase n=1 Tax=Gluconacetobacter johannae TaxID=112140 RepID=A0A7W4J4V6_9PROT|nr:amidase [Gluconacetobacter johannae]MBB2174651.1 amidase [Gluconacetobacter johannae]GBQ85647.1 amidase [Gluconacetobacter johannae DSM 13595]